MPYVVPSDGAPIHFVDRGPRSSSGIVLIHGEPFNSRFWVRNVEPLAEKFRVVAMDVRGRGESGKTEYGQTISQFARDVSFLLKHLELSQVVLVGWSLGSAIGWSYIEQFGQDRLRGFVNVDQSPYRYVSDEHLESSLAATRKHRFDNHRATIDRYLGADSGVDDDTRLWMVYECMKTHSLSHLAIMADSYMSDFRSQLPKISIPNQLHWSSFGAVKPEMANYIIEHTPGCESVFFDDCGHLIPWVQPRKFNSELADFAARVLDAPLANGRTS